MEAPLGLALLPDAVLRSIFSCLHALVAAGPPAAVSHALRGACAEEELCAHLCARDLAQEAKPPSLALPVAAAALDGLQPNGGLLPVVEAGRKPLLGGCGPAARELRLLAVDLADLTPAQIMAAAAREGRPALLTWAVAWCSGLAGGVESAAEVLDRGAGSGRSALMVAASGNWPRTVAAAVAAGADPETVGGLFGTALHMAAFHGAAEAAGCLCRCGADLGLPNQTFGQTPLHVACSRGHAEVVEVLLAAGSNAAAHDKDGMTPGLIARCKGHHVIHRMIEESLGRAPAAA